MHTAHVPTAQAHSYTPQRLAVVLHNLGGPTGPTAVRPFLYNLFTDPDIIKLGGDWRQRLLASLISGVRAPKVAKKYAAINACPNGCTGHAACPTRQGNSPSTCCSPINPLTERQRESLDSLLSTELPEIEVRVFTAMRYWVPTLDTTLAEVADFAPTDLVHLPLYPQFSWTTSGSSFRAWHHAERTRYPKQAPWRTFEVKDYHTDPHLLAALDARIDQALAQVPEALRPTTHLLFSAHGTPLSEVASGDPYTEQVRATVHALVHRRSTRLGYTEPHWLGYQSRVGPAKWTQPNTEALALRLADYGVPALVIVPVAFVTDHIETLMELNTELREVLEPKGLHHLVVTEGLNTHPDFVRCLAQQVVNCLRQPASIPIPA